MKPMLVGESPSERGDGRPFTGPSGQRLWRLVGVRNYSDFTKLFQVRNLCDYNFRLTQAQIRAVGILNEAEGGGTGPIILCGKKVCEAFLVDYEPLMTERKLTRHPVLSLWTFPHPSGRSRYWNDPVNSVLAQQFLMERLNP